MDGFDFGTDLGSVIGGAGGSELGNFSLNPMSLGSMSGLANEAMPGMSAPMMGFPAISPEAGTTNPGSFGSFSNPGLGAGSGDGGGGGTNWGAMAKTALPFLQAGAGLAQIPLGVEALNIARQGQKATQAGIRTAQEAAQPMITAEQQLLPAGTNAMLSGKLPPQLQTQVDNQVNQQRQAMLQQLASAGIDPATAEAMIQGTLEQLRTQLTTQYAQSLLSGGTSLGQGGNLGGTSGNLGTQELNTASQALQGANQSLNRVLAANG
jgi:hypothetical protein